MHLSLRIFILICGFTPLTLILSNLGEISRIDQTNILPVILIPAFSVLAVCCVVMLLAPLFRVRLATTQANRSTA
jgi:hypothetical protein